MANDKSKYFNFTCTKLGAAQKQYNLSMPKLRVQTTMGLYRHGTENQPGSSRGPTEAVDFLHLAESCHWLRELVYTTYCNDRLT